VPWVLKFTSQDYKAPVVSLQLLINQPPPIVEVRTAYCNDMYEWVVVVSLQ